ncbi:MAG: thioredoxin-dependent thiol peroxidase [Chloroflexi bacterium]|nr:thioredoxin-dependent thiol peroxidase [Chloroflexota bacterium]
MPDKIKIGNAAPAFALPDENGKTVKLSDFRGKKVVVYFYPKDNTPGCTAQACGFRDNYVDIQEKNGVVIGISPDSAKSHQRFRTKYNLPFILLSDEDHKVAEKYGAWGEKKTFGVKSIGVIRSHFVIDEHGKVVDAQVHVKAKDSPSIAMQSLD